MGGEVLEFPYQDEADRRTQAGLSELRLNYGKYKNSEIHCITGSMRSSKSAVLLEMFEEMEAENDATLFQHVKNTRDGEFVCSRNGKKIPACVVENSKDIMSVLTDSIDPSLSVEEFLNGKLVFIDELQFFDHEIVDVLKDLRACNVGVFASFLNQDYRGEPFEFDVSEEFKEWERDMISRGFGDFVQKRNVGDVLAITTSIVNMSAIHPPNEYATMSMKMTDSDLIVEAGDDEYGVVPPFEHPHVIKRRSKFQ